MNPSAAVALHSHGVKKMAWASRGSFHDAAEAVRAHTGTTIGKRQVEELALDAVTPGSLPRPRTSALNAFEIAFDGRLHPDADWSEPVKTSDTH